MKGKLLMERVETIDPAHMSIVFPPQRCLPRIIFNPLNLLRLFHKRSQKKPSSCYPLLVSNESKLFNGIF